MSAQTFCEDLIKALDAMKRKVLITHEFEYHCEFCALGALAEFSGLTSGEYTTKTLADMYGLSVGTINNVADENDSRCGTPQERWWQMRNYAQQLLDKEVAKDE